MKIFIYPYTSLILYDLVGRFGHEPLGIMTEVGKRVRTPSIESPPLNITTDDAKHGLKYAAVDVPSGVRGRMGVLDPLIAEAQAAIIVNRAPLAFGCMGCARTNELVKYVIRTKEVPILELDYPTDEKEAEQFVLSIKTFCERLSGGDKDE
ncbi:MAG: methanogenesis marker 5 protein [Methermicoccaceae archaeon]